MSTLDFSYVSSILSDAKEGDSNAFAELYAATYLKQYRFALKYLGDEYKAQETLQEMYVFALTNLNQVTDASMLVPWLCRVNLRICLTKKYPGTDPESVKVKIGSSFYPVRGLLRLNLTSSQALLFRYLCGLRPGACASLMEINRGALMRYMRSGRKILTAGGMGQ